MSCVKYRISSPGVPSGVHFLKQIIVKQICQANKFESSLVTGTTIRRLVYVIMSYDQTPGEIRPKRVTHSRDPISVCDTIDLSILRRANREVFDKLVW